MGGPLCILAQANDLENEFTNERAIDELATHSNNAAITRTKKALELKRGTPDEPDLLYVLGDLQLRSADMRFRTSHHDSTPKEREVRVEKYENWMNQAIASFKEFCKKFPQDARVIQATYLTAKAELEMDRKTEAEATLRHLVNAYPNSKEARVGAEDFTTLLVERGNYPEALQYLARYKPKPEESAYPTYLRNLAWTYFQTGKTKNAFDTLTQLIGVLTRLPEDDPNRRQYYTSAAENLAVFYAAGMKQNLDGFTLEQSLTTFKRVALKVYPEVIAYFALQLRGSGDERAMVAFLKMVEYRELDNPVTLRVALILFEGIANQQEPKSLADAAKSLVHLSQRQSQAQSLETLAPIKAVAGRLQTRFSQNQTAPGAKETAGVLRDILTVLLKATDPKEGKTIAELTFNLGTLSLFLEQYREAVSYFAQTPHSIDSLMGTLEANYQLAVQAGAIPKKVEVKKLPSIDDQHPFAFEEPSYSAIPVGATPSLSQLIQSCGHAIGEHAPADRLEKYLFEIGRSVYQMGAIPEGLSHLRSFVLHYPQSERAGVAAALIMDTLIQSRAFAVADSFSREIATSKNWKATSIKDQIVSAGSEARLKSAQTALQDGRYGEAFKAAKSYLSENTKASHAREAALIAGNAAVKLERIQDAESFYSLAIDENHPGAPVDSTSLGGLLARSELRESRFDYNGASIDSIKALHMNGIQQWLKPADIENVRKNAIENAWSSGTFKGLNHDPAVCPSSGPTAERCEVLAVLSGELTAAKTEHGKKLVALAQASSLKALPALWNTTTPEEQFALIGSLTRSVPEKFTQESKTLFASTPIRPDPKAITARIEAMKSLDQLSAAIIELPIASVQAELLKSLSNAYLKTYQEISALQPTETWKPVAKPFFQKANDLDAQSIQLAANRGVDETTLRKLLGTRSSLGLESAPAHSLSSEIREWLEKSIPSQSSSDALFRTALITAMQKSNLPLIAKLSQEGLKRNTLTADHLSLIRAMLFDLAGARAEAVGALESRLNKKGRLNASISTLLVEVFARLGSKSKIREITQQSGEQIPPAIAEWSGASMVNEPHRGPASAPEVATPQTKETQP